MRVLQANSLKARLIRGSIGSFVLKILSLCLATIISVISARLLGAEAFGLFSYGISWITLLTIPTTLGLERLAVYLIPKLRIQGRYGDIKGLMTWANQIVAVCSSAVSAILILVVLNFGTSLSLESQAALCVIAGSLPFMSLRMLRLASMRGFEKVVLGLIPEMLIAPLLLLILIGLTKYVPGQLSLLKLSCIYLMSSIVSFAVGAKYLRKSVPIEVSESELSYHGKAWLKQALPLMMLGGTQVLYAKIDTIMLGSLAGASAVGIYTVVNRGTQLVTFSLGAVNSVLAPNLSRLYAEGNAGQMEKILQRSAQLSFVASACISGFLFVFRSKFLGLFGPQFLSGEIALIFLVFGHLVSAITGSNGQVINMSGNSRFMILSVGLGAALNATMNSALVPILGIDGAAISTALTIALVNITNAIYVKVKLNLNSTILTF